jgi:predicted O-methyltransferase YrrM
MIPTQERMLRLMDRAMTLWDLPAVGPRKGRVIRRLVERRRPRQAIEIGSLFGYSAILIGGSLPRGGRLTCIEVDPFLAGIVERNLEVAGLGKQATVINEDALRAIPLLRPRFGFAFIDAVKEDYLDYLRALEPRLESAAVIVADNTGIFRRAIKPYLDYVRTSGRYTTREYQFADDCMEVSVLA